MRRAEERSFLHKRVQRVERWNGRARHSHARTRLRQPCRPLPRRGGGACPEDALCARPLGAQSASAARAKESTRAARKQRRQTKERGAHFCGRSRTLEQPPAQEDDSLLLITPTDHRPLSSCDGREAVGTLVALGWRIVLMACTRLSVAQPGSGAAQRRSSATPPRALPAPRRRRCGRCGASRVTAATLSSAQSTDEGASELAYGAALVQGKREEQEDAFTVLPTTVAGGYLYAGA